MMNPETSPVLYRVGIDVGKNSVGCAAVEYDQAGSPLQILASTVTIHDSGVGPEGKKAAESRRFQSGVARRTRRLVRHRRERLQKLDALLQEWGWTSAAREVPDDPYAPWWVRKALVSKFVADDEVREEMLAIAVRHMARHRGWRSPYQAVGVLKTRSAPSKEFVAFRERVVERSVYEIADDATLSQLVCALDLGPGNKLRGVAGLFDGKFMQSDNANELLAICERQQLSEQVTNRLIEAVFAAKSPRGAAASLVGTDPLPGQGSLPRASKASEVFQRFRIANIVSNLRIRKGRDGGLPLDIEQRQAVVAFLYTVKDPDALSWADVADELGIPRHQLAGTASVTSDGDRAAAKPPYNRTDHFLRTTKVAAIRDWWKAADEAERAELVKYFANTDEIKEDNPAGEAVIKLLSSLSPSEELEAENIKLGSGRAAYSEHSLVLLTDHMLTTTDDLHEARKAVFGVDDSWVPPADPIGEPVGNPAVDRVTKIVARFLMGVAKKWGSPEQVIIEHVRDGFMSEATARDLDRQLNQRSRKNDAIRDQIRREIGIHGEVNRSDLNRFATIQRQNGQCCYCGEPISFRTAEMDHIVPRAGSASTNSRVNLVAVCHRCNHSKSSTPFALWADTCGIPGVSLTEAITRVRHWIKESGYTGKEHQKYLKEVISRLEATEPDAEIDGRSMESIAWMATELAHRIRSHFVQVNAETVVEVYRGELTFHARMASGIEKRIPYIGKRGKTRFDRRHHAVDAVVLTAMNRSVARTLAERANMKAAQRITRQAETWREHQGSSPAAQEKFAKWRADMEVVLELLSSALNEDRIPVIEPLRLRLGDGAAHDDTVRSLRTKENPLGGKLVGDEFSLVDIDRATTPQLWCALTRCEDFDPEVGLPANPGRRIRVQGRWFEGDDVVEIFPTSSALLRVRGGYAEIGSTIHHARVYRIAGKKPVYAMMRVFTVDLLSHRHEDLFTAPIPPQAISRRTAEPKLRKALADGSAEYLGWLVVGDELELDMSNPPDSGQIGEVLKQFPGTCRWRVCGFVTPEKFRLRPSQLAAEGLSEEASDELKKIVDSPGWRPAINVLFNRFHPTVVRRTSLGTPRQAGGSLPGCWSVGG